MKKHPSNQTGAVLVTILSVLIFLSTMIYGILLLSNSNLQRARIRILLLQAQYSAESAADSAVAMLNSGNTSYTGTTSDVTLLTNALYKSTYSVTVANGSNGKERVLTAVGKVYAPTTRATPTYIRTIRVTVQRSSTTVASSLLSRNIIDVGSGVKNIVGKDVYVNGFINMNKNTTNLIAENITVAGKNTGASNCSIGGAGNLVKPASFSTSGQTKTNLILGYNNCLTPPGNSSNSNFSVSANQTNISTIQSIYIPWSQYLDSSYTNANNCVDWSGSGTLDIPKTTGSKATHYPDSGSNLSASCGNSGDLPLGSNRYNINANLHIRANLCAATACNPTFYNPDSGTSGMKFIFIEGTINFGSVQTASGSGPIVFITYGSDPAALTGVCPYGGSIYLANSGITSAPAAFFLANNGVCLDKTKFGASPALGGIAGKNLSIATNPGSPFDLYLDQNFPVSQIPIDLAWRAVRYQRL